MRRVRRAAAWTGGAVLLTLVGLWGALAFPPSARWLAARALSAPVAAASVRAEVGSARLWRLGSLRLGDVRFIREDGSLLASVDSVWATYRRAPLFRRRLSLPVLRLVSPKVDVRKLDGAWEAASLASDPSAEEPDSVAPSSPWTLDMDRIVVRGGAVEVSSDGEGMGRVDSLAVQASSLVVGSAFSVGIDSLSFTATSPGAPGTLEAALRGAIGDGSIRLDTLSLSSPSSRVSARASLPWSGENPLDLRRPPQIELEVDAPRILLGDLGFLGADLNPSSTLSASAGVDNPSPGETAATARVEFGDGGRAELTALLRGGAPALGAPPVPLVLTGTAAIDGLDPSYVVTDAPAGDVTVFGEVNVDLVPPDDSVSRTAMSGDVFLEVEESVLGSVRLKPGRLDVVMGASETGFDYRGALVSTAQDLEAEIETRGAIRWGAPAAYRGEARLVLSGLTPEPVTLLAEADARGSDPDSLSGTLTLEARRQELFGRPLEARLAYRPESGAGPWSISLAYGPGTVDGDGSLALGPVPHLTIARLAADSLDWGPWVRDSLPSYVSAVVDGELRGTPGPLLTGSAEVRVASWSVRGRPLPPASASVRIDDGTVRTDAATTGTAPSWSLSASATPFETPPAVTVHRAEVRGLDPASLMGDSTMTGSINGRLAGRLRGPDLATGIGYLEITLDSSQVAAQPLTAGAGSFELSGGILAGRLSVEYPDGDISGAVLARFGEGGRNELQVSGTTFRGLDLGRFTADAPFTTSLTGELEGSLIQDPAGPATGEASLRLASSTVNASEIESGTVVARLAEGRIEAEGGFGLGGGGAVELSVSAALDAGQISSGRAQASFELPELGALLGTESPASIHGEFEVASSDAAAEEWTFQGSAWSGRWENLSLDTLALAGQMSRSVVEVDTLLASGNAFEARGGGLIALDATAPPTASFRLNAELTDALPLASLIDAEVLEIGTASAELRVGRRGDDVVLEGQLDANAILVDELRVVGLSGDWFVAGASARQVDTARVTVGIGRIVASSELEIASTDAQLHYDGDRIVVEAQAGLDEARDGELRAIVDPISRGRRFEVERFRFSIDQDQWLLEDGFDVDWSDGFRVGEASLVAGDQRIAFGGRIHATEPDSFTFRTQGFRVGTISDLLGFPRLEATLTSDLALSGSLSEPEWTFEADADVQRRGQDRGSVNMGLSYGGDRLEADVTLRDRTNQAVTLSGFVPVDLDFTDPSDIVREASGDADLQIQADSFDLQWFSPFVDAELVSGLGGIISADARIGGRTVDPVLSGRARVTEAGVTLVQLGTTYSGINADLLLDGRTVQIQQASLSDGNGSARLTGNLSLESLGLGRFDLTASLDEFLVVSNALSRARTSGEIRLRGTTDAPHVEGSVEVVSADVYLTGQGSAANGRQVEEVELTAEDLATLREVFGYSPPEDRTDVNALVSALSANLDIVVGRDSWLRQRMNPEMAVQMSGELTVEKAADSLPRVVGTISPVAGRSYVEQWGRRFQMESGQVVFRGPPLTPEVQLSARYAIPSRDNPGASEVVIQLDVEGRPDSLRLILSSTPSMDNADIVSYIATGRPAAQSLSGSGETPNVTDVGVELAAERLTSAIEGLAADAIGLDVVEIRREGTGDAVLVAGRYVSPRLYIGFQQPVSFGSGEGPARESTGQRAEIEYEAFRWLLLNLEGGRSDVEFFFRTRYGY